MEKQANPILLELLKRISAKDAQTLSQVNYNFNNSIREIQQDSDIWRQRFEYKYGKVPSQNLSANQWKQVFLLLEDGEISTNKSEPYKNICGQINDVTALQFVEETLDKKYTKPELLEFTQMAINSNHNKLASALLDMYKTRKSQKEVVFTLKDLLEFKKENIEQDRNVIVDKLIKEYGDYPEPTPQMMKEIFDYYDKYFFKGVLSQQIGNKKVEFVISNKASKTAGSVRMGNPIRIMLAKQIFDGITENNIIYLTSNGLHFTNRVEAIVNVMEHELTHVLLQTSSDDEHALESHGDLFKGIVLRLFGHTETTHGLLRDKALEDKICVPRHLLKIGDNITFIGRGKVYRGKILKMNPKRAHVRTDTGAVMSVPYPIIFSCDKISSNTVPVDSTNLSVKKNKTKENTRDGEKIKFMLQGKVVNAVIQKRNPKTLLVLAEDGKKYKLGYSFLL